MRQLEKQVNKALRKLAFMKARDGQLPFEKITPNEIEGLLGKPPFYRDIYQGNDYAGVVTGLAWTSVGGEILFIETSLSKGKAGKLTLTGNLGDVMKESAVIALEYVKAHVDTLGIDYRIFDQWNIHIHVPEGATPKDGPSAGITIATSIASALTQRKVRKNTAMTGEITLRGKVLPVGGIKEKILAAKRAGITDIVMCRDNKKDIDEIPEMYLQGVQFHYVENVQDVWKFALTDELVAHPIDFKIEEEKELMTFELQHTDTASEARTGLITTDHGQIKTPIFMPVGTCGSVKGVHFAELREQVKAQIILGNTYHLYLRPGLDILRKAGGLHQFNTWDRPILTDSGGFQVFSLTGIRKLREEGCEFRSHIDGSKHIFTPENVMDTERVIGADIMMALDECPPGQSDYQYAKKSLGLTQRWLDRCVKRFNETEPLYGYHQSLFPIVQGCTYKDLRQEAAKFVADKGADGNAIGGLAVGEPTEVMYEMIEVVNDILPKDRPRYLMGVGTPQNILEAIERGVDMFDCVMPTRNGRNAMLFTYHGTMNMRNKKWEYDFSPIDEDGCEIDRIHTKAYLHHLFKAQELLVIQIASIHNLASFIPTSWRCLTSHRTVGDFT